MVPDRDPIGGVDAEHRVAGRVHERFEHARPAPMRRVACRARSNRHPAGEQPPRAPSSRGSRYPGCAMRVRGYSPRKPAPHADEGAMTDHPAIEGGLGPEDGADLAGAALALARRFAAGATMWCLAPELPEHARHVAVEFVHPVIMGKRALPAVAVDDGDPVTRVAGARAPRRHPVRGGAPRRTRWCPRPWLRARVWGLTTVWIGAGPAPGRRRGRPRALGGRRSGRAAAYDGSLVLRYHVLWELTHVCFEHPGLLVADDGRGVRHRRHVHHLLRRGHAGRGGRRSTSPVRRRCAPPSASSRST